MIRIIRREVGFCLCVFDANNAEIEEEQQHHVALNKTRWLTLESLKVYKSVISQKDAQKHNVRTTWLHVLLLEEQSQSINLRTNTAKVQTT
jgi:hypothetical protein